MALGYDLMSSNFNDYTFDDTLFDNPQKAVVIDPYCKLRKLHKYNVFEL